MRVGTCRHNRRGVALVFALFTIGLLITMSATVVGLAIRHGRTGLSSSNAEAALHAANWGVEAALNYMGMSVNTNGAMHWAVSERVEGYAVGYRLTSTTPGERRETLGGLALAQVKIPSTSKSEEAALIPSDRSANECRLLRFKSPDNVTQPYDVWIDDLTRAQVEVMVSEYLVAGQPSHYLLTSIARVFSPENELLATRVVEARVREQTALDFMHFIQNARAWDANGADPANVNTRNIVWLPEGYLEDGRMRVDGGGRVPGTAGTVQLWQGNGGMRNPPPWRFTGDVTIAGSADSITNRFDLDYSLNDIFTGGLKTQAPALGLPQHDNFIEYARAQSRASLPGKRSVAIDINGDPASAYAARNPAGGTVPDVMPRAGDARPSFAKIVVTLDGANVRVDKVNPARPGVTQNLYSGAASDIANGIISVRGGNVEVQSTYNGNEPKPFTGNLTIVASDNTGRAQPNTGTKSYPQNNGTIYSDAARAYFIENPHLTPPYTEREVYGPSGSSSRLVWPSPPARIEREGNTFVTSDIKYGSASKPPGLGMISENFVLLNDKNPSGSRNGYDELRLDAVLMSLDHSVQFDWDNMAGNANHDRLMERNPDRTFTLNGAIVSGFLDVEGDVLGRGYYTQNFTHDKNLRFQLPPHFPRWDRASVGTGGVIWNWVIMNFVDQGSLNRFTRN
jgi:hypothetical protein